MERYDALFWKAFGAFFGGLMMVFIFDFLLVAIVVTIVYSTVPTTTMHVLGSAGLAIFGFVPLALIFALAVAIFASNTDDDKELRTERLWAIVAKGNDMTFCWNLAGIAFMLICLVVFGFRMLRPADE